MPSKPQIQNYADDRYAADYEEPVLFHPFGIGVILVRAHLVLPGFQLSHSRSLGSLNSEPSLQPLNLVIEASGVGKPEQVTITSVDIKSDAEMELSKIYGTHVERSSIALIQVIGSVHQAVEEDAVLNPEHMAGFMRQDLAAPAQHK